MKVELHLHTTRYSGCAVATPYELMRRLIETGYDAAFITEHDAVWHADELVELKADFPGIRIFSGVELSFPGSDHHLLVLGTNDPRYLSIDNEAEVLDRARSQGRLTVLAHPFRYEKAAEMLREGLLPDAIEFNTCNQTPEMAAEAVSAAEKLKLPLVNAGDVHSLDFVNRFWIETTRPIGSSGDIRPIVTEGAYRNCAHPE